MKKNLIKLTIITLLLIFTTGCLKYEMKMGINADKSVDLDYTFAVDMSSFKDMFTEEDENPIDNSRISDEEIKNYKDKGYEVKVTEDKENYKYEFTANKKFKSIDDISTDKDVTVNMSDIGAKEDKEIFFKKESKGKKNIYTANFLFANDGNETDEYSTYSSMFDTKYIVTLPVKPISHNATEVSEDGKTLTWKLQLSKTNEVKYSFEMENKNNSKNSTLIIIGATLLTLVAIVVVVQATKKKKTVEN